MSLTRLKMNLTHLKKGVFCVEKMTGRYDQAEILMALWKLGAGNRMIPTSGGILDHALAAMKNRLPRELTTLTFGTTGVGFRSFELPDILLAAQEAMLVSEPNPTYLSMLVKLNEDQAAEIAINHGLRVTDARNLGSKLRDKIDELEIDADNRKRLPENQAGTLSMTETCSTCP